MPQEWSTARRLLCVRLDSLGDVLMTTPAIRALRQSAAGRHLTLLTSPSGAEAARLVPEIDEMIVYEAPWMKHTPERTSPAYDFNMIERLARANFDGAVIFTVFSQNPLPAAMLCYLAGIPLRLAHSRENPYQLLTQWSPEPEPHDRIRHEVRRQLDLVAATGATVNDERLRIEPPLAARKSAQRKLARHGISTLRPWLVVHAGSTAASRRYPPDMFAAVAESLLRDHGFQLVFTGDAGERPLVESIRSQLRRPTVSLAGELSLAELSGLIAEAPLLLSNNTGPVHIAAAVGTPVVDLYALTNPQHTPWMVPSRVLFHDVPCRNCFKSVCPEGHHDCLRKVSPDQVVDAVLELFRETQGRSTLAPRATPVAV
jgi:lipopolysaccharide heptosyltransferase II